MSLRGTSTTHSGRLSHVLGLRIWHNDVRESCLIGRQTTIHLRLSDLMLVRHWPQLFSEYQGCEGGMWGCWWVLGLSETYWEPVGGSLRRETTAYDERIVRYNKLSHQIHWGTTKLEGRHSDGGKRERVKFFFLGAGLRPYILPSTIGPNIYKRSQKLLCYLYIISKTQ